MKTNKRRFITLMLAVFLIVNMISATAYAASYNACSPVFMGWSCSVGKSSNVYLGYKTVGGLDNRSSSQSSTYEYSQSFTHSLTVGGSLSSELSSTISGTTGVVSGGLGSKVNASASFSGKYERTYSETFTQNVPARMKLTLKSQKYGIKITGYAKKFVAWVQTKKGTVSIRVPTYQVYKPVLTY